MANTQKNRIHGPLPDFLASFGVGSPSGIAVAGLSAMAVLHTPRTDLVGAAVPPGRMI